MGRFTRTASTLGLRAVTGYIVDSIVVVINEWAFALDLTDVTTFSTTTVTVRSTCLAHIFTNTFCWCTRRAIYVVTSITIFVYKWTDRTFNFVCCACLARATIIVTFALVMCRDTLAAFAGGTQAIFIGTTVTASFYWNRTNFARSTFLIVFTTRLCAWNTLTYWIGLSTCTILFVGRTGTINRVGN